MIRGGWIAATVAISLASAVAQAADTLRLAITAMPMQTGNPYRSGGLPAVFLGAQMFDALVAIEADGSVAPALALSWEQETPTRWVFRLRPDVTFSNGEPFNADAIVAAVSYMTSDASLIEPLRREVENLASAEAIDDLTVAIETDVPDVLLPRTMAVLAIAAPIAWIEKGRDGFAREPAGTGPFRLVSLGEAEAVLEAVPQSWRPPEIDRIVARALPDRSTRVQALQADSVDIAVVLGPDDRLAVESAGHRLASYPVGAVMGLAFVTEGRDTPVDDVRVRRALNYAVDKSLIIAALLDGTGAAAGQPATPDAFGYDPRIDAYPYDPDTARRLLLEAGYADGLALTMELVPGTISGDSAVFQQVAADLARVGVNLTIRTVTFPTFAQHYNQGDWGGDGFGMYYNLEPSLDALRAMWRHSCLNRVPWYCDAEAEAMMGTAFAATDENERRRMTQAVMRRYHDQAASLFLTDVWGHIGVHRRVEGFAATFNRMSLETVSLME